MAVYVDEIQEYPVDMIQVAARRWGNKWCHMTTNGNIKELHHIAEKIGMRRDWFQDKPKFPHYDLLPSKRLAAIRMGAQEVSSLVQAGCRLYLQKKPKWELSLGQLDHIIRCAEELFCSGSIGSFWMEFFGEEFNPLGATYKHSYQTYMAYVFPSGRIGMVERDQTGRDTCDFKVRLVSFEEWEGLSL